MLKERFKNFILRIGIRNNFHKLPYWMTAIILAAFLVSLYLLYFSLQNYFGAYTGCDSCSR